MKRNLMLTAGVVFCLFSATLSAQREVKPVVLQKISNRLYEIVGGRGARGGAYIGDTGVLVIDAKMDSASVSDVLEGIQKLTDKSIRYLVNTHSDGDHIQGNRYFPKGVVITAHENCRKEFFHSRRDGSPSQWNDLKLVSYIPSLTFQTQMQIYLGTNKVELYYFGKGHTTGDAVVYFPEEKTAFIGDQIFLGRPQLIHAYKGGNSFDHVRNLTEMLKTLDAQKFFSGHSEATDSTGIQNHIDQMKIRQTKVMDLIQKGKDVGTVIKAFPEDETNLIKTIFQEIKGT
jgi:cyclase